MGLKLPSHPRLLPNTTLLSCPALLLHTVMVSYSAFVAHAVTEPYTVVVFLYLYRILCCRARVALVQVLLDHGESHIQYCCLSYTFYLIMYSRARVALVQVLADHGESGDGRPLGRTNILPVHAVRGHLLSQGIIQCRIHKYSIHKDTDKSQ